MYLGKALQVIVPDPTFDYVEQCANRLDISGTFSKLCALASMRVGYAVAMEDTDELEAVMTVDNTNLAGAVVVLATLEDDTFL